MVHNIFLVQLSDLPPHSKFSSVYFHVLYPQNYNLHIFHPTILTLSWNRAMSTSFAVPL